METLTYERDKMSIRDIDTIKIGTIRYKVVHEKPSQEGTAEDKITVGCIKYDKGEIWTNHESPDDVCAITLMHEVVHGLFNHSGAYQASEKQVEGFATVLTLFIQDNPKLIEAIQKLK